MVSAAMSEVEEKIRNLCLTKRLRPSEFFIDYDRLRSGYVTGKMVCIMITFIYNVCLQRLIDK